MFRPTKKKKPSGIRVTTNNDNDAEPDTILSSRPLHRSRKHKPNTAVTAAVSTHDTQIQPQQPQQYENVPTPQRTYDANELEILRQEQQTRSSVTTAAAAADDVNQEYQESELPPFVYDTTATTLLDFSTSQRPTNTTDEQNDNDYTEYTTEVFDTADDNDEMPPEFNTTTQDQSIAGLRQQVLSTRQQLLQQQQQVDHGKNMKETEYEQLQHTNQLQATSVQDCGQALEFYQQWRVTLAAWVGAMRDLNTKVVPIEQAFHELQADVAANERYGLRENDTISVLYERGILEQIMGRQPPKQVFETATTTDEFGRDTQTQFAMLREQRKKHRSRIQLQRSQRQECVRGDESDGYLSDQEQENFRERRMSLQEALDVALQELDDKYTQLHNLFDLFAEWQRNFPEDYQQCFACLSLADLASVLIRVELCSLNDAWNESHSFNETKWVTLVHASMSSNLVTTEGAERIIEKAVLPSVEDLLEKSGYNPLSSKQTRTFSTFYDRILRIVPSSSPMMLSLRKSFNAYLERYLRKIAIPIIRKDAVVPEDDEELKDAVDNCTMGQTLRIRKVLMNILNYWAPILGEHQDFVDYVLEFLCNGFLFLLSSLSNYEKDTAIMESSADIFKSVWSVLEPLGWLERPELLVQGAPLRAAASAYLPIPAD